MVVQCRFSFCLRQRETPFAEVQAQARAGQNPVVRRVASSSSRLGCRSPRTTEVRPLQLLFGSMRNSESCSRTVMGDGASVIGRDGCVVSAHSWRFGGKLTNGLHPVFHFLPHPDLKSNYTSSDSSTQQQILGSTMEANDSSHAQETLELEEGRVAGPRWAQLEEEVRSASCGATAFGVRHFPVPAQQSIARSQAAAGSSRETINSAAA